MLRYCAPKPCQQSVLIHQMEQGLNLIASVHLSFPFTGPISKHSYTLRQSWVRPSTYKFGRASSVCNTICSRCNLYLVRKKKKVTQLHVMGGSRRNVCPCLFRSVNTSAHDFLCWFPICWQGPIGDLHRSHREEDKATGAWPPEKGRAELPPTPLIGAYIRLQVREKEVQSRWVCHSQHKEPRSVSRTHIKVRYSGTSM